MANREKFETSTIASLEETDSGEQMGGTQHSRHGQQLFATRTNNAADRTLLLLHGGGVAGWMWQPLLAELGTDFNVLVPDLPGHDRSASIDYRSHAITLPLIEDLLESFLTTLPAEGSQNVTVLGFSLGAQLTVALAAKRPDLAHRAIVVSAQAKPLPLPAATSAMLSIAAPLAKFEWFARAQAKELFIGDDLFDDYLRTSRSISKATLLNSVGENIRFTPPAAWAKFPGKVRVFVGANERSLMRDSADILAGLRPSGAAEVIAGCGHGIPLQRPELLAACLREEH